MNTIYKYQLTIQEEQVIEMPSLPEFLSLQVQNGLPTVWVIVQTGSAINNKQIEFKIVATGQKFANRNEWFYVGTVQIDSFVWHVFSKKV